MSDETTMVIGRSGEGSTCGVLVKFTPSELRRIDACAAAAGMKRTPWIKKWLGSVCDAVEGKSAGGGADG